MRNVLRTLTVAVVCLFLMAPPSSAEDCVPQDYQITINYYNASQQPVGWETYYCGGGYNSNGTLSGVWSKETDVNCCTNQTVVGYFYFCPEDEIWHTVSAIGETDCP